MFSVPSVPISDGCSICLEPETPATGPYVVHNERHPFHQECLWQHVNTQLLSSNGGLGRFESVGCPICRERITHIQGIPVTLPIQNPILAVRGAQNQIDRSNATPLFNLGHFHYQNDCKETALAYWNHSLAQENLTELERSSICASIGNIHAQSMRYSAALPFLEAAWNSDLSELNKRQIGLNLAHTYFHLGNYLKATSHATHLIDSRGLSDTDLVELYWIAGISTSATNLPEFAHLYLSLFMETAPEVHPQREQAELLLIQAKKNICLMNAELGASYFNQTNYPEALAYLDQVVRANPEEVTPQIRDVAQMQLGICYFHLEDFRNASFYLNQVISSDFLDNHQKWNAIVCLIRSNIQQTNR